MPSASAISATAIESDPARAASNARFTHRVAPARTIGDPCERYIATSTR